MTSETQTAVLIVGAGPTGLTVANILARRGIAFRIIERDAGPTVQSRALWVHARTLELWDKLGVLATALSQGRKTNQINILVEGQPKGAIPYQGDEISPFPFGLVLEQSKTQRILLDSLTAHGGVVEWATELVQLAQDATAVHATLRHADGHEELITASYLVAGDGARSVVRHALGLTFEGDTYPINFFLGDVEMEWQHGHEQVALNVTKDLVFAFFPMYGPQQFRLIGSLPAAMKDRDAIEAHEIEQLINANSGLHVKLLKANWTTIFHSNRRIASHYQAGRCFLIGDAAHIHTPAGGQGMNLGIGDAFNLAWKLADVVNGAAQPVLLDSYEPERLPIAQSVLNRSDRLFDLEAGNNPVMQQLRLWLFPAAAAITSHVGRAREFVFDFLAQTWVGYRTSPAVAEALAPHKRIRAAHAGDRAPFARLTKGGSIYDLFAGLGYQLLVFPATTADHGEADSAQVQATMALYRLPFDSATIGAEETEVYQHYDIDGPTMMLIRPDGHIAFRSALDNHRALEAYLDSLYIRNAPFSG